MSSLQSHIPLSKTQLVLLHPILFDKKRQCEFFHPQIQILAEESVQAPILSVLFVFLHVLLLVCPNRTHSPDQSDESQNNRIALTVHQFRQNNFLHLMVAGFHQSHPFELIFLFQFLGHSRVLEQLR